MSVTITNSVCHWIKVCSPAMWAVGVTWAREVSGVARYYARDSSSFKMLYSTPLKNAFDHVNMSIWVYLAKNPFELLIWKLPRSSLKWTNPIFCDTYKNRYTLRCITQIISNVLVSGTHFYVFFSVSKIRVMTSWLKIHSFEFRGNFYFVFFACLFCKTKRKSKCNTQLTSHEIASLLLMLCTESCSYQEVPGKKNLQIPTFPSLTVYKAENPEQGNTRCQRSPPIHVVSPLSRTRQTKGKKAVKTLSYDLAKPCPAFTQLIPKH